MTTTHRSSAKSSRVRTHANAHTWTAMSPATSRHDDWGSMPLTRTFIQRSAGTKGNWTLFCFSFLMQGKKKFLGGWKLVLRHPSLPPNDNFARCNYNPHCTPCTHPAYKKRRSCKLFQLPATWTATYRREGTRRGVCTLSLHCLSP
jgi:hypothetical protein